MPAKFRLGQVVRTPDALEAFQEAGEISAPYLIQHQSGDWGDIPLKIEQLNELSLRQDGPLLSGYTLSTAVAFGIFTGAARRSTVIFLEEEFCEFVSA